MKNALILGITGQDGAYLACHLLKQGYNVIGTSRDAYLCDTRKLQLLGIANDVKILSLSLIDFRSVLNVVASCEPQHIYNLSGMTSVGLSFELPVECVDSIITATINLLEVIRFLDADIKFFNASSSECFGESHGFASTEQTLFRPLSPYAVAKASAYWQVAIYRDAYDLFCCSGILSNHESPLRPNRFVTQKIISHAKLIQERKADKIYLGDLDVSRDWGWAPEYVEAINLMLNSSAPKDYVIASGKSYTLRQFAESVFEKHGLDFNEYYIKSPLFNRPSELRCSLMNPAAIQKDLGWSNRTGFHDMVEKLSNGDLF